MYIYLFSISVSPLIFQAKHFFIAITIWGGGDIYHDLPIFLDGRQRRRSHFLPSTRDASAQDDQGDYQEFARSEDLIKRKAIISCNAI